LKTATN